MKHSETSETAVQPEVFGLSGDLTDPWARYSKKRKFFFFSPVSSWPKLEGSVVQGASAASDLLNLWFPSQFRVWVKLCCFICFNSKWWCFWCFWCYWRLKMLPQWCLKCGYHSSSRDDWKRVTIFQSRSGSQEQTGVTCGQAWVKSWIPL